MNNAATILREAELCPLVDYGFYCFLVDPQTRKPYEKPGLWSATNDEIEFAKMRERFPNGIVAVNLHLSGLIVVDVDQHEGGPDGNTAYESLLHDFGLAWTSTLTHSTPRSGKHLFFRLPEGMEPPKSLKGSSSPFPGIDLLSRGSYVVWSGETPNGLYERTSQTTQLADVPQFLLDKLAFPRVDPGVADIPRLAAIPVKNKSNSYPLLVDASPEVEWPLFENPLGNAEMRALELDPLVIARCYKALGVQLDESILIRDGRASASSPFREDKNPSCEVYFGRDDRRVLFYEHVYGITYTMRALAAARFAEDPSYLGTDFERWNYGLRILGHIGAIKLPAVRIAELPANSPKMICRVYDGFLAQAMVRRGTAGRWDEPDNVNYLSHFEEAVASV